METKGDFKKGLRSSRFSRSWTKKDIRKRGKDCCRENRFIVGVETWVGSSSDCRWSSKIETMVRKSEITKTNWNKNSGANLNFS